jgi:glycerophosphoryl diester phosphodiesterase
VIAHRGASAYRPENTLSAYELAVGQHADMIEIDLHRTRDGAIVVTHDESPGGLGGAAEIADASLAEIEGIDAGAGERIPTLDRVLDGFGARIAFNLEIKRGRRGDYPGLEAAALEAVARRGLLERTLFSSFYDSVLAELRRLEPRARIGLLISPRHPAGALERAAALDAEALHPEASLASPALVERAHAAGLAVYVYTVDDPAQMERLLRSGVDGLFSNVPDRLRSMVDRLFPASGVPAPISA